MHPARQKRLYIIVFILLVSAAAVFLLIRAFNENLSYFKPPFKIVSGEVPVGMRVRAGGCVIPGTISQGADELSSELRVAFSITDGIASVPVRYNGVLPDLFAEKEAAVIKGVLQEDASGYYITADEVLAKHDENYMPPEVADAMHAAAEQAGNPSEIAGDRDSILTPGEAEEKAMDAIQHAANCKILDYDAAMLLSGSARVES